MIKFIFKGVIRDKSRSLIPVIIVSAGVFLTVFLSSYFAGVFGDMIDLSARFTTGHVKVVTKAYAENEDQMPLDLALLEVGSLKTQLNAAYPDMEWVERIHFGGLLDVPDENGETRAQGPAIGTAIDLLSPGSTEIARMSIQESIAKGSIPSKPGEALISEGFAQKFAVSVGDEITIFGSTMNGSMMFKTFIISGTLNFGNAFLDRGAVFIDLRDAQLALDMEDASSEILGYFTDGVYNDAKALEVMESFNSGHNVPEDEFSPQMMRLVDQNELGQYLSLAEHMSSIFILVFVMAMSIVLWNTGLLGGLRRYSEYGIRLALGEEKKHIFFTTLLEAAIIGIIGSVFGTLLGLAGAYYLQTYGLNLSGMMDNVGMMMPAILRSKITPELFYIGFFPGVIATVFGNALAGYAIYKRKTSRLFKELEV